MDHYNLRTEFYHRGRLTSPRPSRSLRNFHLAILFGKLALALLTVFAVSYSPPTEFVQAQTLEDILDELEGEEEHTCEDGAQRTALKAFYDAMNGDNWHDSTNWNTTEPLETWYGLVIHEHDDHDDDDDDGDDEDHEDCVTEMDLSSNGLSGELTTLEGMTALHGLILSNNEITGEIPDLGHLHMEELDLSHNLMSGEIDLEHLATEIHTLLLNDNMFSGPFPDLSGTRNLSSTLFDPGSINSQSASFASQNSQTMNALNLPSQEHPAADGLPELVRADLSNNMLTGNLPDMSVVGQVATPTDTTRVPTPSKLRELIVYPGNPGLSGAVHSSRLPMNSLKKLVIGSPISVPGEDPQNPERLCGDNTDIRLRSWAERPDTTFTGAFCGDQMIAEEEESTSDSAARLGRIEPHANILRARPGDDITLKVNIYGRQGIQDQSLANRITFEWQEGDRTLEGTGASITYSVPSNPGKYTITASLEPGTECHGLSDPEANCTASFSIQILRVSSTSEPISSARINPTGDIPTILADSSGNQYEVFTPVHGGQFTSGSLMLTVGSGAVPNGDVVGLRVDDAGAASNTGMTHQRYTLAGSAYTISAVDASGTAISVYRLNSPLEFCAPLPDALLANISDVATLSLNSDGSLTVLSTKIRISDDTLLGCANISTVPATVGFGTSGAPDPIPPTAIPEPLPTPPDTGGQTPRSSAVLWFLLIIGAAATAMGSMLWRTGLQRIT